MVSESRKRYLSSLSSSQRAENIRTTQPGDQGSVNTSSSSGSSSSSGGSGWTTGTASQTIGGTTTSTTTTTSSSGNIVTTTTKKSPTGDILSQTSHTLPAVEIARVKSLPQESWQATQRVGMTISPPSHSVMEDTRLISGPGSHTFTPTKTIGQKLKGYDQRAFGFVDTKIEALKKQRFSDKPKTITTKGLGGVKITEARSGLTRTDGVSIMEATSTPMPRKQPVDYQRGALSQIQAMPIVGTPFFAAEKWYKSKKAKQQIELQTGKYATNIARQQEREGAIGVKADIFTGDLKVSGPLSKGLQSFYRERGVSPTLTAEAINLEIADLQVGREQLFAQRQQVVKTQRKYGGDIINLSSPTVEYALSKTPVLKKSEKLSKVASTSAGYFKFAWKLPGQQAGTAVQRGITTLSKTSLADIPSKLSSKRKDDMSKFSLGSFTKGSYSRAGIIGSYVTQAGFKTLTTPEYRSSSSTRKGVKDFWGAELEDKWVSKVPRVITPGKVVEKTFTGGMTVGAIFYAGSNPFVGGAMKVAATGLGVAAGVKAVKSSTWQGRVYYGSASALYLSPLIWKGYKAGKVRYQVRKGTAVKQAHFQTEVKPTYSERLSLKQSRAQFEKANWEMRQAHVTLQSTDMIKAERAFRARQFEKAPIKVVSMLETAGAKRQEVLSGGMFFAPSLDGRSQAYAAYAGYLPGKERGIIKLYSEGTRFGLKSPKPGIFITKAPIKQLTAKPVNWGVQKQFYKSGSMTEGIENVLGMSTEYQTTAAPFRNYPLTFPNVKGAGQPLPGQKMGLMYSPVEGTGTPTHSLAPKKGIMQLVSSEVGGLKLPADIPASWPVQGTVLIPTGTLRTSKTLTTKLFWTPKGTLTSQQRVTALFPKKDGTLAPKSWYNIGKPKTVLTEPKTFVYVDKPVLPKAISFKWPTTSKELTPGIRPGTTAVFPQTDGTLAPKVRTILGTSIATDSVSRLGAKPLMSTTNKLTGRVFSSQIKTVNIPGTQSKAYLGLEKGVQTVFKKNVPFNVVYGQVTGARIALRPPGVDNRIIIKETHRGQISKSKGVSVSGIGTTDPKTGRLVLTRPGVKQSRQYNVFSFTERSVVKGGSLGYVYPDSGKSIVFSQKYASKQLGIISYQKGLRDSRITPQQLAYIKKDTALGKTIATQLKASQSKSLMFVPPQPGSVGTGMSSVTSGSFIQGPLPLTQSQWQTSLKTASGISQASKSSAAMPYRYPKFTGIVPVFGTSSTKSSVKSSSRSFGVLSSPVKGMSSSPDDFRLVSSFSPVSSGASMAPSSGPRYGVSSGSRAGSSGSSAGSSAGSSIFTPPRRPPPSRGRSGYSRPPVFSSSGSPGPSTPRFPKFGTPTGIIPFGSPKKGREPLFKVEIRREGKFKQQRGLFTEAEAKRVGAKITTGTLARSFRITQAGVLGTAKSSRGARSISSDIFRKSSKERGVFIQRATKKERAPLGGALASRGEVEELFRFKRGKAKKKKKKSKRR